MNITFFIGNGFDINLGLKTKYSDFYPYFIEHASKKNMIRTWMKNNIKLWADLEEKLGEELSHVNTENLQQFYNDKDELDNLLLEYLETEQEKYSYDKIDEIKKEFTRSMLEFTAGMSERDKASISRTMKTFKDEDFDYSFIVFNYTHTLDKMRSLYKNNEEIIFSHHGSPYTKNNRIGSILHIHGTTKGEMILAVNDETQIKNEYLQTNQEFLDTFVKRRMNQGIGQGKEDKAKKIIANSRIICIFGMSIGNTDKIWWEVIVDWLISSENNKLIIFKKGYNKELSRWLPSKIIRLNNCLKSEMYKKGKGKHNDNQFDLIKDRIMISYNSNIFSFPKVEEI